MGDHQIERRHARDAPETMLPIVRAPEDISVIVVGGGQAGLEGDQLRVPLE